MRALPRCHGAHEAEAPEQHSEPAEQEHVQPISATGARIFLALPLSNEALGDGRLQGVKSDARTLVVVESLRSYAAALPPAQIKPAKRRARRAA